MKLVQPTIIVVCGHPASGKTAITKLLAERLNAGHTNPVEPRVHFVDNDDVRKTCVGTPYPYPQESRTLLAKDKAEMSGVYKFLFCIAEWHLAERRSLILTASFSRKAYWINFLRILEAHRTEARALRGKGASLKIVQCILRNDAKEEVEKRLTGRSAEYSGSLNSLPHYLEVKARYEPIEFPHLEVDTSPPKTPEECAEQALQYVLA